MGPVVSSRYALLLLAGLPAASGCRCTEEEEPEVVPQVLVHRGDLVVIEERAAEFVEGRVLSSGRAGIEVELAGGGNKSRVAPGDVYPLPPNGPDPHPGELAICRGPREWFGCRLVGPIGSAELQVTDAHGEVARVVRGQVLRPSSVTKLNLERSFQRGLQFRRFVEEASRAGRPRAPASFELKPRAPVIALRGRGWYDAHVHELVPGGAYVEWNDSKVREMVRTENIVSPPPHQASTKAGDYVLLRPSSVAEPWRPARVEEVSDGALSVTSPGLDQERVSPRDVLPLAR